MTRNDAATPQVIAAMRPSHLILSPGPGRPGDAGVTEDVIRLLRGKVPMLGICLGHQAICEVYGARITLADHLMHGKQSDIHLESGSPLFADLPPVIRAARYHSLIASPERFPDALRVSARDANQEIMAVESERDAVYGLQFHPESILTPDGAVILKNFFQIQKGGQS